MTNWTEAWEGCDSDRHYLIEPHTLFLPFVGGVGGLWVATDGGLTCEDIDPNLATAGLLRMIADRISDPERRLHG